MKKIKKISIGMLASAVVVAPIISSVSFASNSNVANQTEINVLKNYFNNIDLLKAKLKPHYAVLQNKAINSPTYDQLANWVKTSPEKVVANENNAINYIASLPMSEDLKEFGLLNYWEKYTTYQDWLINRTKVAKLNNVQDDDTSNSVPVHFTDGKWNNNNVMPMVSHAAVENIYILANNTRIYYRDDQNHSVPKSGQDETTTDYDHDPFSNDYTHYLWSNQTILNYAVYQAAVDAINDLKDDAKVVAIKSALGVYDASVGVVVDNLFKKAATTTFKTSTTFALGGIASAILSAATQDWSQPWSAIYNTSVDVLPSLLAGSIFKAPVGLAVAIGQAILNFIPSGNGHSIGSNMTDHGLNDWDYQVKNNWETIVRLAVEWSMGYTHGIDWEICDSIYATPTLRIKTQDMNEGYRSISGDDWFNNDFNWGHKVQFVSK